MHQIRNLGISLSAPLVMLVLSACNGTTSPAPAPSTQAPTSLTYATNPAVYTSGVLIPQNQPSSGGGAVVSYTVVPALPGGLGLSPGTGIITGTPTAATATAVYTVTATNAAGSTPADLTITVNAAVQAPSNLTYSTNPAVYTSGVLIPQNQPSSGGGAVVSYTVAPALPGGLGLSPGTGIITGTPTAATATAVYTVTATNAAGSTPADLTITVAPPSGVKAWTAAATLSQDNPGTTYAGAQIAFGGGGQATAVWTQFNGASPSVWARRFSPGGSWTPAVRLEVPTSETASAPHVAMDAGGGALVVWLQQGGSTDGVWADHFTAGAGWDGAVLVHSGGAGTFVGLLVAVDGLGRGVAAWTETGPVLSPTRAAQYQPGSGWGTPVQVLADTTQMDLALNAAGAGMLVASAPDAAGSSVFSVTGVPFSTAGGWGAPVLLEADDTGGWDINASIAIDPSGRAVAVWQRFNSATFQFHIRSNSFAPGTGWGQPQLVESATQGFSRDPRIALDPSGNGTVVWVQDDSGTGGHVQIWADRYTLGSGWGTAGLIEAAFRANSAPAQQPQVAADPAGDAFAVWVDFSGDIQGAGYVPGTGWGTARSMGPGTTQAPSSPQIAFDGDGNAFAIWSQVAVTTDYAVWVSRYQ